MHMKLSTYELNRVAITALVDRRTLRKYLTGRRVQPMTRVRIERALEELGYAELVGTAEDERREAVCHRAVVAWSEPRRAVDAED